MEVGDADFLSSMPSVTPFSKHICILSHSYTIVHRMCIRYMATLDAIKNDSGFHRVVNAIETINAHVKKQAS